jgi:competence protein ComEC
LVVLWVYQSPLRRGVLIATSIWLLLFPSAFFNRFDADLVITNHNNSLALADQETTLLVDAWAGNDIEKLMFGAYLNVAQEGYLLSSKSISELTPHALLHHDVKWVILKQEKMPQTETILDALGVNWLVVPAGESLAFYFQNDSVSLRHSLCVYDFFLLKSDTCKRVEKLESVLNYRQI